MASFRPARTLLAAALALAAAPALAEGPYSQTVFIGDSLTDAGFYRPLLPASVRSVTGQFTTNPGLVWSQWLADYYGTDAFANGNGQTGTNYAAGGARVGVDTVGALGPTPSLMTQTTRYLAANGGAADPNGLYTVWGGANDLFAVAAGAPAQATIAQAVGAQVQIVGMLQAAGAQYVIVPNVPDLGLTPTFRAQGAAAAAQGTALATAYNTALYGALAQANLRVIPVDTFNFLREVAAAPSLYGFTNVTGTACQPQVTANSLTCNPTSLVSQDAPNTYLFADGVHPTTGAHRQIADLALSMLEAPRQVAVLPHSAAGTGRGRADRVAQHVAGKPEGDGTRWWTDVRGDFQRYGHGDNYDGAGPALTGGVDWARGNTVFGVFGGYGVQANDWGLRRGDWDQKEATIGGFIGWYGEGGAWVNGQLSYTDISFDIDRDVVLGPAVRTHHASPDGENLTAAVSAGFEFGEGAFRHGPVVTLISQQITVDEFAEDQATLSTSLAYPEQEFDSMVGSVGWQVRYAGEGFEPYARLTIDREFEDSSEYAWARSQSITGSLDYQVPGMDYDQSYGTVLFGARTHLFGLETNLGTSLNVGQKGGKHATVFATFGGGF